MPGEPEPVPRPQPLLWIDSITWEKAGQRAAADHLSTARVLEVLLDGYADGRVTITPVGSRRDGKTRTQHRTSLAQTVLDRVLDKDGKLVRGDAPSLSRLAEVLLAGYADGQIVLTVSASGHAGRT